MSIQKIVLSAFLSGTAISTAYAQTEAGKLLVSGQVNYSHLDSEYNSTSATRPTTTIRQETKQHSFNFIPQFGFFVADNLALGIRGGVSTGKQTEKRNETNGSSNGVYSSTRRSNTVFVGPFIRYYKMIDERWGFYGQLSGGYQRQKDKSNTDYPDFSGANYSSETEVTGGYGSLQPGFVFFPTKKIGLELTLGSLSYTKMDSKSQDRQAQPGQSSFEGSSSSFGADFGLQYLAVGASFHLGN